MSNIRDVAAYAGVSPATVSRVINHDPRYKITVETQERVWQAVAELNYKAPVSNEERADHTATIAQAGPGTQKFGCIMNVSGGKYNDPYYLTILSGFEKELAEKGYGISFIRSNEELNDSKTLYDTFSNPINGLVIMNTLNDDVFKYVKKQTPYIVGIDTDYSSIDNVAYDHYEAAFLAIMHLREQGYKRIGFIGGFKNRIPSSRRFNGYYAALHTYGLEYNPDWVVASNWDEDFCAKEIKALHAKGKLPDAFFVSSDLMAIAALRALFDLGVSVPGEVAVIGLSNIEISKYSNPPLSTIALPIYDMGRVAAQTLLSRIGGDDTPSKVITLHAEVLKRSST